jgi:uncharacterized protein (DUF2141 family)
MISTRKLKQKLALGALALGSLCGRSAVADEGLATNMIEFETQTRNDAGVVRCGLFTERGWLKDTVRPAIVKINKTTARCVFKEIPAGTYGISAFHDEDNDGKLDTNLVGYPTEDYCASNNARNMFSAPSWKDAKFTYKGGRLRLRGVMK